MKVAYDFQAFSLQRYGGISRFFTDMIDYLNKKDVEVNLLLKYSHNEYLKGLQEYKDKVDFIKDKSIDDFLSPKYFKGKGRLFNMYKRLFDVHGTDENRKYAVEELQKGNFDVFHPTYYEPYFLDYLGSKPFVLSVHDFTHEIYPEFFDVPAIIPQRKKLLIERASKVVAISENTKKDIIKYYGTDPRKIEVIHLSSDLSVDNAGEIQNVPEKYILFVGNRSIYKNFYCFVRVAASLMNEDPHLHLVCCGGGKHSPEEELLFEALRINGRVHYFGASNSNLVNLYKRAAVFVFPSLYEGFGIPVLEAFSCNCPVACSSTSSLPEVALDAAEYFNPKDFESMKESIKRVIYDKELRTRLAELGAKRFKDFSVDKTATQMLQVYKSVI